jgi:threonylcarbamoyladenosine tRNA methylthiotransferase MtaB
MTRVYLATQGCKLNQAESESLRRGLEAVGYLMTDTAKDADVMVINTCTVTNLADRKARQAVRSAGRIKPGIKVIVTGCYAERQAESVRTLPGVTEVVAMSEKDRIPKILPELGFPPATAETAIAGGRTRSFIKIQDGCDYRCAYCIVPTVRPRKSAVPVEKVIDEIRERRREGCREVVLTGTEVGEYRIGDTDLAELIDAVLKETDIERLRISSLQPREITPELMACWRNSRMCRHFHLSLQSGSDPVLRRMRRRYNTAEYAEALVAIRQVVPEAAVTSDIIAGFPGETDSEFADSLKFIEKCGFARLHVFPFSARPGTPAAGMEGQVDRRTVRQRTDRLLALAVKCEAEFRRSMSGRSFDVLFEEMRNGQWEGYTDNYLRVSRRDAADLTNRIMPVVLD